MGYYTSYKLTIDSSFIDEKNEKSKQTEIDAVMQSGMSEEMKSNVIVLIQEKYKSPTLDEKLICKHIGFNPFKEACKWYDHSRDMRRISAEYPTVLFTLDGDGEEEGDIWKKYFYNGKMQHAPAKITFDSFDESKLE